MSEKDFKPKVNTSTDVTKLDLSPEEGFVLSRIDGSTSVEHLSHLTGMAPDQVGEIVDRLAQRGALEPAQRAPAPAPVFDDGLSTLADGEPITDADADIDSIDDLLENVEELLDGPTIDEAKLPAPPPRSPQLEKAKPAEEEAEDDDEELFGDDEPDAQATEGEEASEDEEPSEDEEASEGEEEVEISEEDAGNFRKLYNQVFKEMDRDQRVKHAREETGAKLCALCFDPDPGIIRAVLENMHTARQHARLIAEHHRTATGISHLASRQQFLSDSQVQRFLLRNVQTSDPVLTKMLGNRPLIPLYKVTTSRELSDRAKRNARQAFRTRWNTSGSDEKAALLFKTEGRCLNSLIGLTIDAKTAQLITARTIHSVMFIQSLCRFPATPPNILVHVSKSAAVNRAPHIKKLILQHPNCPSSLKRGPGR